MGARGKRSSKIFWEAVWEGRTINVALRGKRKKTR